MKKSRIAKFALLGASTAALAATLTTSTYAWYVSNKEAKVSAGTGNTGSAGADGSVLLSWNGSTQNQNAVWGKELSFTSLDCPVNLSTMSLQPVHYDTNGFYGVETDGTKPSSVASAANYISFTVWAKTESSTPISVTPSIKINNTTDSADVTPQLAYVDSTKGAPTGKSVGSSFAFDCLDALYVQQTTDASTGTGDARTAGAISALSYVAASKQGTRGSSAAAASFETAGTGNAHTYFTNVSNTEETIWAQTPACTDSGENAGSLSGLVLTQTPLAITYVIFLDGGDIDCFNSCAGQNISFELTFAVA